MRPAQWLGDVSYSVYLWHWPLIVLIPLARRPRADTLDRVLAIVLTLVLAALTKTYVEDRFRTPQWGIPLKKPFLLGAAGMAVVVVAGRACRSTRSTSGPRTRRPSWRRRSPTAVRASAPRPSTGTPSSCPQVPFRDVVPAPADAANDKSEAYADVSGGKDCFSYLPHFRLVTCEFGDPNAPVEVALVGNSHAGQWLPALQEVASKRHWRIATYLASQCAAAETPPAVRDARDERRLPVVGAGRPSVRSPGSTPTPCSTPTGSPWAPSARRTTTASRSTPTG